MVLANKYNYHLNKSDTANLFWMGDLSIYEIANLESFIESGFKVNIWTYDMDLDFKHLLNKIDIKDANLILDKKLHYKFRQGKQKSSMSSFSNIFRFELLKQYGGWWFDMDCICIKDVKEFQKLTINNNFIIGKERINYTGSSVLFFNDTDLLNNLVNTTWDIIKKNNYNFFWGEIGPDLISEIILNKKLMSETLDQTYFYEISADRFNMLFKTFSSSRINTELNLEDAFIVHTWNEIFKRYFISKSKLPPKNSYLYYHLLKSIDNQANYSIYSRLFNLRFSRFLDFFVKVLFRLKIYLNNVLQK